MKNWLKIALIVTLGFSSFAYGFSATAQISVYNIQIEDLKDGRATLKWRTNESVRSEIYYGLDAANLTKKLSYPSQINHQASLYGLEEDKDYYYQIILYSLDGEKLTLYPRSFSTKDMADTKAPRFINAQVIETAGNSAAISWQANEKVAAEIEYYKDGSNTKKITKKIGNYKTYHEYFIYNLDTYSQYYIQITIRDKAGNKKTTGLSVNIYNAFNKNTNLQIKNIEPLSDASNLITYNQATIKFKSTLPAKSYIKYGTSPNRLNKKVIINDQQLSTEHQITIADLDPGTIYYYNIYASGSFYKKKTEVEGLSFATKGNVLGVKENAISDDNDKDQLSNAFEIAIGTDPNNSDSDNDGYKDYTEVKNGYNPLGPGKWDKKIGFAYGQPRWDIKYEQSKTAELKKMLDKKLPYIHINSNTWQMLANAYIYGGYPIDAIAMYVKLDGYTVHPDIDWANWQNSPEYQKYEKYIQ